MIHDLAESEIICTNLTHYRNCSNMSPYCAKLATVPVTGGLNYPANQHGVMPTVLTFSTAKSVIGANIRLSRVYLVPITEGVEAAL